MEEIDVLIIGAGVIGLAVAERLADPSRDLVVAEMHEGFGRETSSRNSEVIHCGMYYAEELLKTRLCVEGNPRLYELCRREGIPHRRTGKIVVATDETESEMLQGIFTQGKKNGVSGLSLIDAREIAAREPDVHGILGLHSRDSGIVDSHRLMAYFEHTAISRGATLAYNCEVTGIAKSGAGYSVE